MEVNDWADWGQSDWDNGWTNSISQNFNRQTTPKEQGSVNTGGKVHQSASGYFEKTSAEDDWIIQNQTPAVQGQNASYSLEAVNNNNSLNQIENREIAPPDNKQRYGTSQIRHNHQDSHNARPKKLVNAPSQASKQLPSQRQHFYNNSESSNISNYFKPKQTNQVPPSHPEPYHSQHFTDVHSVQNISSGPASFGGGLPVHQQQLEEEPQFSSLGHQTRSFEQPLSDSNLTKQQNLEFHQRSSGYSSLQFNPGIQQDLPNPNFQQPPGPPGGQQQHYGRLAVQHNSRGPQVSSTGGSAGFRQLPKSQREDISISHPHESSQSQRFSPPQHQSSKNTAANLPPPPMAYPPQVPPKSEFNEARNSNHNANVLNQSSTQLTNVNMYPPNVSNPQLVGNVQLPPSNNQNSLQGPVSVGDNNMPVHQLQLEEVPLIPPSFQQSMMEPLPPKQQNNEVYQSSAHSLQQNIVTQQQAAATSQVAQTTTPVQQQFNLPVQQQHSSAFRQPSMNKEEGSTPRHYGDNHSPRYTPSPQQHISKSSSNSFQPPPIVHSSQLPPPVNSEVQEVKTSNNSNLVNQSSFQVSNMNIFPPMATSSPLVNNSHLPPENEERIPENREYPDNTEDIAQDLKGLKISPPRDAEQEAQKHCAIDRNQYLETGQFSAQKENNTYIQNVEVNDEGDAPPPGLHRLVTGQGYEPWGVEPEGNSHSAPVGESAPGPGATRNSSPLSSIGDESEGREDDGKERRREVPGEAEPLQGRVVLGQIPTPPDVVMNRNDRGERDRLERMVVGDHGQSGGNTSDDYRQGGRSSRHTRHRRNDSYEKEERDYSSDRDRRNEDHRRRDDRDRDRTRRRREHRSPEYRSDEEYDERRGFRSLRDRHPRHYYHRDYDDYYRENQRSRPSSRSGSDYRHPLKHSMRVLPGHHYYHDPSPSFHEYNMKYSSQREYFERMRQVDPAGYAAWYYQYMQGRFMQESARAFSSDRASVHSGQSSSNQRHGVSTPQEAVDDLTREEEEADYTARLYDCAHIRGNMDGHGRLIVVEPNYPADQQKAIVNVCRLSQVSLDKDSEDFFQSPGPFIPGVTHRNTVLQYLKRMSDKATKSSEKLLYDLVHMTVKGNGEVNGSDVAELLMESYKKSVEDEVEPTEERTSPVSRFRELLQQGNKAEALEWAMDNGAWGHALFLASKMGERTHNDIMLRFANSIPHNDPLQTLYQLMSGYIPQAATCCADKKWSDWRPHLAMILSNPTGNINLDRQSIITLGDSLNASGRLFASHFCYVTAQVEFSSFRPDAKLVLLGSSHNQEFSKFAACRAIMLTMCYEYGLKLRQPTFNIPTLQVYKMILAARLIDSGRIRNALQYCELLAQEILSGTSLAQKSLVASVIDFSSRLKMFDPVLALSGNTDKDPDWLSNLKRLHDSLPDDQEMVSHNQSPLPVVEPNVDLTHQEIPYQISDTNPNSYIESGPPSSSVGVSTYQILQQPTSNGNIPTYQPLSQPPMLPSGGSTFQPLSQPITQLPPRTQPENVGDIYHQQGYMAPTSVQHSTQQPNSLGYQPAHDPQNSPRNLEISSGPESSSWEPKIPAPMIQSASESNQPQRNSFFKATEEQLKLNEVGGDKKKDGGKPTDSKGLAKNEEQSSGWFGGIWEKIALRPKNQMRLPDDSNPSIIWDEKEKKWVNLDGDSEGSGNVKPPPKASEALPPQGNKYKIQKGKLMKSNYVDVMGNKEKSDPAQPNFIPNSVPPPVKTNFFIPSPVEGNENAPVDFITPAPHNPVIGDSAESNKQQLSRSSSVSSLSREVQYYMAPHQGSSQGSRVHGNPPPHMYNPSRYPS